MRDLLARQRNGVLLVVLVFAQGLLVGQQLLDRPFDDRLSYWSSILFRPFQGTAQWAVQGVSGMWASYFGLVGTAAENRRLDAEAARLRLENLYLQQQLIRMQGREELNEFRESLTSLTLPARVIAHGPHRSAREIFLDRGRDHGVRPGMAVLAPEGIVGKVEVAYGSSSMVVLVSDAEAGAGVVLGRSGALGVLRGKNGSLCRLDYVAPNVAVEIGEEVYASGMDGIYPPGAPVGTVASVDTTSDGYLIEVDLHVDLDRVRELAVVLRADHESLPDSVQQDLAELPAPPEPGSESEQQAGMLDGPADRVKLTYRRALDSQEKKVGLLSGRPPDLSAAADSLRADRGDSLGALGELE